MSDPVVETPLAVGGLGITRRVILRPNRDDLSFSVAVDSTAEHGTIFDLMDTISAVTDRERLKADLAEKRDALRVAREQPAQCMRDIQRVGVQRNAYINARETWQEQGGRRSVWKPNDKQKADLEQFDNQIMALRENRANFMRDIPIIEHEILVLEALIKGHEPPPRPPELEEAMSGMAVADAAE